MRRIQTAICLLLILPVFLVAASAAAFQDTAGLWCEESVAVCADRGLMEGVGDGRFGPEGTLTYAQVIVLCARLDAVLSGLSPALPVSEPWYQSAADRLMKICEDPNRSPHYLENALSRFPEIANAPCSRGNFLLLLSDIVPKEQLPELNRIEQLPDTETLEVLRFYRAGVLAGVDPYGTFRSEDRLSRGQAAALLARILVPETRLKYTLRPWSASESLLGLKGDETLFTVNGAPVSAELFTWYLTGQIEAREDAWSDAIIDAYPDEYEAYYLDDSFWDSFAAYLVERCFIPEAHLNYLTSDRGGLSESAKILSDTIDEVTRIAVLLQHEKDYPLTRAQKSLIAETAAPYGYSAALQEQIGTAAALLENMAAAHPLSSTEMTRLLEDSGYVYGQTLALARGYDSDSALRAQLQLIRSEMVNHLDEPDFVQYLIYKYTDGYADPQLLSLSSFAGKNRDALTETPLGQVTPVLTEEGYYFIFLRLNPLMSGELSRQVSEIPPQIEIQGWADAAVVETLPLLETISIADAAAQYRFFSGN